MAASHDECVAQYPRQQICIDRAFSRLLSWAAYITAQALPPAGDPPAKDWVQQRVLAERTPAYANLYVGQVVPYLLEIPNITNGIRDALNAWNDEATEATIITDLDSAMAVVMPKYAAATVSDQEVANWCDRNGYPHPPGLVLTTTLITTPPGPGGF